MSLYGKRPARIKVAITSKRVGEDETIVRRVGSRCVVQRSGACLGEFLLWFPRQHYVKLDAKQLHEFVDFTDQKERL